MGELRLQAKKMGLEENADTRRLILDRRDASAGVAEKVGLPIPAFNARELRVSPAFSSHFCIAGGGN